MKQDENAQKVIVEDSKYDADSIDVLDDMDHIRRRPGMYVDSTDDPRQLLSEAFDNALDEAQSGFSALTEVFVNTQTHEYAIRDYGRGIPIGMKELPSPLNISDKCFFSSADKCLP